ncbi:hypothetical protein EJ03DRAFT_325940 [Teratosphaeria nubilosa]|uniref:Uncharacterized protein n=1 Tax=Teratosphaeria nubilosa TaxID=161662 RepID=A0A6G1LDX3_9PEZI|nr:hypothetical protein EJ03DRAFT_325940 [Teratosphaeria nubilosa]
MSKVEQRSPNLVNTTSCVYVSQAAQSCHLWSRGLRSAKRRQVKIMAYGVREPYLWLHVLK